MRYGIANAVIGARRNSGTVGYGKCHSMPTITTVAAAAVAIAASIGVTIGIIAFAL
jgi:hypothetical protein